MSIRNKDHKSSKPTGAIAVSPKPVSPRDRVRYRIDNTLARGDTPVIGLLAVGTTAVVLIAGIVIWVGHVSVNGRRADGIEGTWLSLLRTLDPGTMGSDQGWRLRVTSLFVTITGILIVSTLIGLLANGIDTRLQNLRRGKSRVIEKGHTLVLGWSPKMRLLLRELGASVDGNSQLCVVVLAEMDNEVMEREISLALDGMKSIRVVTRSGSPGLPASLELVAPRDASSVIVLRPPNGDEAETIRAVLALESVGLPNTVPVILELVNDGHARAIQTASGLKIHALLPDQWISLVTARAVLQPTLATVYEDLLDFEGSEIYFKVADARLVGTTMRHACASVHGAWVFGLCRGEQLIIAPPPETTIEPADQLMVVAVNSTTMSVVPRGPETLRRNDLSATKQEEEQPDVIGVIGWSDLGAGVLQHLDRSLPPNSHIHVLIDPEDADRVPKTEYEHFQLRSVPGDTTDPDVLGRYLLSAEFDRILILSGRHEASPLNSDARVLLTMLEVRHLLSSGRGIEVTVEMADPRNVELVRNKASEEFIVGERLVSLLMAQISRNDAISDVLNGLLSPEGPELVAVPVEAVAPVGTLCTLGEIGQTMLDANSYLIGYRSGNVPQLDWDLDRPVTLSAGDQLVVVRPAT